MAFPTIPTAAATRLLTTNQATATTTHTFPSLTTLAQAAGDLMIAVIVTYNGGAADAQFSSWGGSFTEFVDQSANSTTIQSIGAAYKWATGSETGTFTVTSVSSTRSVMFLMTIPGAHASTIPEATAKANGTSAAADPAALDPAGWGAEDTLWVAVGVNGETSLTGSFTGITAAPTNYTGYLDSGIIGGDIIGALEGAVAFRQLNTASENVGTWTLDVGAAGNSALLIGVRPVPTPPEEGSATGTIAWVGAATGTNVHSGSATGSITWAGTADGVAPVVVMDGVGTGSITWTGSATGTSVHRGAATGNISWTGSATGTSVHRGSATGVIGWVGTAAGDVDHQGSATGAVTWTGTATGDAPTPGVKEGTGTGTILWAGTAAGATTHTGTGSGTIDWVGTAAGNAPGIEGIVFNTADAVYLGTMLADRVYLGAVLVWP